MASGLFFCILVAVAPHAGAWIEIDNLYKAYKCPKVAPHAGAWIEMGWARPSCSSNGVAPHAGAWIEITSESEKK